MRNPLLTRLTSVIEVFPISNLRNIVTSQFKSPLSKLQHISAWRLERDQHTVKVGWAVTRGASAHSQHVKGDSCRRQVSVADMPVASSTHIVWQ